MLKGFKEFIMRGNVIDLAVAVVIGAAFTAIVNALVTGILNPALGAPRGPSAPKTSTVTVKSAHQWPPFSTDTLTLDGASGEVVRTETFAAQSAGQRARRWIRLLHSGEALGTFVAALSGLACLGGCVLVYTGFALAWRRFFGGRKNAA